MRNFSGRLKYCWIALMLLDAATGWSDTSGAADGEIVTLPNGIPLPADWPPDRAIPEGESDMAVPYLDSPPSIIPIDVGRQLFVDDFLISQTDLKRTYHTPEYFAGNPILEPDKPWETSTDGVPYAAPFSDGVWYDERAKVFRMWYLCPGSLVRGDVPNGLVTAYAESADGVHWSKPGLDVVRGTNIVDGALRDSNSVWLDKQETDATKRFKLFNVERASVDGRHGWGMALKYSADGIHWSQPAARTKLISDRSTVFYNPFTDMWIASMRFVYRSGSTGLANRRRTYAEHRDPETLLTNIQASAPGDSGRNEVVYWFGPWTNEVRHPDFSTIAPAIYNHDAIVYESLFVGFFSIWQGPENSVCRKLGIQKRNEVLVGYSRDGFHWQRPDRQRFHGVGKKPDDWNGGNIQSVTGSPLIVGDQLYFYMSGRRANKAYWDGYSSTGLATLRRDGFASMDATDAGGALTTRLVSFQGKYLFVNVSAANGALRAEILDRDGKVIEPFTLEGCRAVREDSTKANVTWAGADDLSAVAGRPVHIRFWLNDGSLFSFWVSRFVSGESGGYTAGGGPGLHPSGRDLPATSLQ